MNRKQFYLFLVKKVLPVYFILSMMIGYSIFQFIQNQDIRVLSTSLKVVEKQYYYQQIGDYAYSLNRLIDQQFVGIQLIDNGRLILDLPNSMTIQNLADKKTISKYEFPPTESLVNQPNKLQIKIFKNNVPTFVFLALVELLFFLISIAVLLVYKRLSDQQQQVEFEKQTAQMMQDIAKQVSHDIRSPLAALSMVVADLKDIPADRRLIIKNSAERINDIANTLLKKQSKQHELKSTRSSQDPEKILELNIEYLPRIIENIVSEKRVQYRELQNVQIELDDSSAYDLFAKVDTTEIQRVISNLVNNSIEAFQGRAGLVTVQLKKNQSTAIITIVDNGHGIPKEIINKLGEKGFSHGKAHSNSGSGLGLFHAKQVIQQMNGQLSISSQEGHGTQISIELPVSAPPNWFKSELVIKQQMNIVCVDDDISIHQIWANRIKLLNESSTELNYQAYTSNTEFKDWYQQKLKSTGQSNDLQNYLFLVDYEFINQKQNGFELIQELGIQNQACLVTSRYEDEELQGQCIELGLKIIPKSMASLVPLKYQGPKKRLDAILIDDDTVCIHPIWKDHAKINNKQIEMFTNYEDFKKVSHLYAVETPIYIDSSLGNNVKGEVVSKEIYAQGFTEIYLCTGYEPDHFPPMPWIKKILGKEPLF